MLADTRFEIPVRLLVQDSVSQFSSRVGVKVHTFTKVKDNLVHRLNLVQTGPLC